MKTRPRHAHAAPTELGLLVGEPGYTHAAPTELGLLVGEPGYRHLVPTELPAVRVDRGGWLAI